MDITTCAWSPDGTLIAYSGVVSDSPPTSNIYVAPVDGSSDPVELIAAVSLLLDPAWHPGGELLAVSRSRGGVSSRTYAIWTVEIAGGPARILTPFGADGTFATPTWSPDGTRIGYAHAVSGPPALWIMSSGGRDPAQFGDGLQPELYPAWSPDGRAIALAAGEHLDIWVYYLE